MYIFIYRYIYIYTDTYCNISIAVAENTMLVPARPRFTKEPMEVQVAARPTREWKAATCRRFSWICCGWKIDGNLGKIHGFSGC
jgi:hypothetical protein